MKAKLYPLDQVQTYLIIDIVLLVFLFISVLKGELYFGLLGTLALLTAFLGCFYVLLWYRDWRQLLAALLGCGILTILSILYYEWVLINGFMIADLLGRNRSKIQIVLGMGGLLAMFLVSYFYYYDDPLAFTSTTHLPVLMAMLLTTIVVRVMNQSKALKQDLAFAHSQLERYIQEEERHRIARDLHDTIGQTLTMIKLKSELAIRLVDQKPEQAKAEMNSVVDTSRFALKQVRELVTSMKHVSLEAELEQAALLLQSKGVRLIVKDLVEVRPKLTPMGETMLALSLREALTNVLKHSQAHHCILTMEQKEAWYCLSIEDDGKGLPQELQSGHGMDSIRERMRLLQGYSEIKERPERGVLVTLCIPLSA